MKPLPWLIALFITMHAFVGFSQVWISNPSTKQMLVKQPLSLSKKGKDGIQINPNKKFQIIDGFGYTLTGGSAQLILAVAPAQRQALLKELFGVYRNLLFSSMLD
jgi:glucosylceramidase